MVFNPEIILAKLYFSYSAMNAGKSTLLLQASYNYQERGMETLLLISAIENRTKQGEISSRIGLNHSADIFTSDEDIYEFIRSRIEGKKIACIFIDEAQWMSGEQIWQLAKVVDDLGVPVMCYGLRTDFQGKTFPGSAGLLAIADEIREIRTICWCGSKATMVVRLDGEGRPLDEGEQIFVGGNDSYVSLCRKHWSRRDLGKSSVN